jgi:N-acetylneuraminic acid mutarotase
MPEVEIPTRSCAVFPAGGRASACACALNGKGYVLGGRNSKGVYHNDLWQYDPMTDTWTSLGNIPGDARVNATMIAYQGCLYMGLGFRQGTIYVQEDHLRDWWRFNPATNQWDSLAPYPDVTTIAAVPFIAGNRIYVLYGATDTPSRQINWYDPVTNSWHQLEDDHYRALTVFKPVGAQIQDQYYFGLGYNQTNMTQWYRVNLVENQWTKCSSLPGKGRTFSACCATNDYIYVFGGRHFAGDLTGGEVFADMLRFDPTHDQWTRGGVMPCGSAENQIAFAINGKAYFGLGENADGQCMNQLYCIEE